MTTLGRIIEAHSAEIVQRWEAEAGRTEGASGLSPSEFRNLLPAYLSSLARHLAAPAAPGKGDPERLVESHLATRLRQGFKLAEILNEFAILGRCISATWRESSLGDPPDGADVDRLHQALAFATSAAAALFGEKLVEEQQLEKRYLRRLQKIVSESGEGASVPLAMRVRAALLLIAEAVGADAACFFVREPGGSDLQLLAQVGGAPEVAATSDSMRPGSLAIAAAATLESISLSDASAAGAYGQPGLRAALAVQVAAREHVLGVLQVGLRERRIFADREVRMLETMGERLGLLMENARLFENLAVANRSLRLERDLREQFVSVLAHDLLGPLAAAKMGAQLLTEQGDQSENQRSVTARILRSIARTDHMVRDLLDVNQIRAGHRLVLRLAEIDLVAVVRELVDDLALLHGKRFVLEGAARLLGIWDAADLRRACWNLATNALKYGAPAAPITITLAGDSVGVRVVIHNEGVAIPFEDQATLFEPFVRTQRARTETVHGWGLGLALVRGCAEAHGGKVELESTPERGTTFTICIPYDARPFQPTETRTP